jgi:2-haloacid dehalogenase
MDPQGLEELAATLDWLFEQLRGDVSFNQLGVIQLSITSAFPAAISWRSFGRVRSGHVRAITCPHSLSTQCAKSGTVSSMDDRWATFDCYGTLVDWNSGIRGELVRMFGPDAAPSLLARYHEVEPQVEAEDPGLPYRDVMRLTLARVADPPEGDEDALARSLPQWPVFPEVPTALMEARDRGWKLAILSNTDRDFIEESKARIGVPFEETVVASEIGSYKPAHRHWEEFFERTGADREPHVHVAASLFHDIAPARELGLKSVWINRLEEPADIEPTRELPDLSALPDVLGEVVKR